MISVGKFDTWRAMGFSLIMVSFTGAAYCKGFLHRPYCRCATYISRSCYFSRMKTPLIPLV